MQFCDQGGVVARVQWYFVPDNTPFFPDWHLFGSNNWIDKTRQLPTLVGEVDGAARPWANGKKPESFNPDLEPCNPQFFALGSPIGTQALATNTLGLPTCCTGGYGLFLGPTVTPTLFVQSTANIGIGVTVTPTLRGALGLSLAATVTPTLRAGTQAGLSVGASVSIPALTTASGVHLGAVVTPTLVVPGRNLVGVHLGAVVTPTLVVPGRNLVGVQLGAVVTPTLAIDGGTSMGPGVGIALSPKLRLATQAGLKLGPVVTPSFPVSPCSSCDAGTTPATWQFTGSGFTGAGVAFNSSFSLSQVSGTPCAWQYGVLADPVHATVQIATPGNYGLFLYLSGSLQAVYQLFSSTTSCSVSETLGKSFSTIGGASTITINPV